VDLEDQVTHDVPCILIGGPGRSGTNILKDIFRQHPLVLAFPFETRFTVDPDGLAPTLRMIRSSVSPFVGEAALARLGYTLSRMSHRSLLDRLAKLLERATGTKHAHRSYRDWELAAVLPGFAQSKDQLIRELTMLSYSGVWAGAKAGRKTFRRRIPHDDKHGKVTDAMRRFLHTIYANALAQTGKTHLVDDNTFNILYATELLDLLPSGKLLHMVRDPRDVVASYLQQRWTPNSLPEAIRYYRQVMSCWLDTRSALDEKRLLEIRLEDLCKDPKSTLGQVASWADLPFHDALLNIPLNRSNSGRWTRELDLNERTELTRSVGEFVHLYGYPC
jgi:hypothetical protein